MSIYHIYSPSIALTFFLPQPFCYRSLLKDISQKVFKQSQKTFSHSLVNFDLQRPRKAFASICFTLVFSEQSISITVYSHNV